MQALLRKTVRECALDKVSATNGYPRDEVHAIELVAARNQGLQKD